MAIPCSMQGISSLTRNWTHAPCGGSTEFQPLDLLGSPSERFLEGWMLLFWELPWMDLRTCRCQISWRCPWWSLVWWSKFTVNMSLETRSPISQGLMVPCSFSDRGQWNSRYTSWIRVVKPMWFIDTFLSPPPLEKVVRHFVFLACTAFFSSRVTRQGKREEKGHLSGVPRGFQAHFSEQGSSVFIPDWHYSATVTGVQVQI